jgi:hypothetical protein
LDPAAFINPEPSSNIPILPHAFSFCSMVKPSNHISSKLRSVTFGIRHGSSLDDVEIESAEKRLIQEAATQLPSKIHNTKKSPIAGWMGKVRKRPNSAK